ncbi:helix-turn-helix domain-containing protein [Subtercola frigoramans]|uniref:Transcriptional regulator with XRE-family HTH domain n=1 Tax=Subtercola frigoramans TaxID=120298 RepID=A0ABS2L9B7_9MICO|nr:XRE family transcriptional regulator [Subtercola frigoramans]MBM7473682.1 transcriptional regulator with XRE-family HTH domain [Subtercola frigoramans]
MSDLIGTNPGNSVATILKAYRTNRAMTLAQVSKLSGISIAHLSRMENGERSPSVKILLQLSRALGVSMGELAGAPTTESEVHISRISERAEISLEDSQMISLSDPRSTTLQAIELTLMPGRRGEPAMHLGEEWIHVLKGKVDVSVDGLVTSLQKGDALHFRAERAHFVQNPTGRPATVLVVSSIGSAALRANH